MNCLFFTTENTEFTARIGSTTHHTPTRSGYPWTSKKLKEFKCVILAFFLVCSSSSCSYSNEAKKALFVDGPSTHYLYEKCTDFMKSESKGNFSTSEGYCENFIRSYLAGYATASFLLSAKIHETRKGRKGECILQNKNVNNLKDIAGAYLLWVDQKNNDELKQYDPMQARATETFGQMIVNCQAN